ncbi:MAG: class I SAM-dependent methyltransferase family protein [Candidatus Pacearchaeota archaeon]
MERRSFDVMGNIALVKFPEGTKQKEKEEFAKKITEKHKGVETVVEKADKFKGRLRKMQTKHILGEKNKEVFYRENGCSFRFNIDECYFSPRLSNERKEISSKIKKGDKVLVMFAGVGPFSIVIAKNSQPGKVVSNEINRQATSYAKQNVELNKVQDKVDVVQGDIKKACSRLEEKYDKFDVIVMPRPQLKDSFLQHAFKLSKSGTKIIYYGFCDEGYREWIKDSIKEVAEKSGKKTRILKTKKAGEVAPYRLRLRVEFKVI